MVKTNRMLFLLLTTNKLLYRCPGQESAKVQLLWELFVKNKKNKKCVLKILSSIMVLFAIASFFKRNKTGQLPQSYIEVNKIYVVIYCENSKKIHVCYFS